MRHYVHSIGVALLVKLKPKRSQAAADRYAVHANPMNRVLASILFMDVERSTEYLVRWGDAAWRDALDHLYGMARSHIAVFRGRSITMIGDQIMAAFEGPIRAICCADAIQREAKDLGLGLRAGVHIGEVERRGNDLRGIAVHIAARIAALANGNEILVSATVRDIVSGSGLLFADRGEQLLKGVPDPRRVFSVAQRS